VLAVSVLIMIAVSALYGAKALMRSRRGCRGMGASGQDCVLSDDLDFDPLAGDRRYAASPGDRDGALDRRRYRTGGAYAERCRQLDRAPHLPDDPYRPGMVHSGGRQCRRSGRRRAIGLREISWLFFSAGLVFWIVLLTLVMNRLIFHDPLPARLLPTLVILIAPPAVAFLAYTRLTGDIDAFARILLNSGYVFAAIVATQIGKFMRLPFALSWWALSFPVAALTIASFLLRTPDRLRGASICRRLPDDRPCGDCRGAAL
jgi:hypothetical protein